MRLLMQYIKSSPKKSFLYVNSEFEVNNSTVLELEGTQ